MPSLGNAYADYFTNAAELGPTTLSVTDEIIVRRFLIHLDMIATYQVDLPRGILLLAAPQDDLSCGEMFLFERETKKFYFLRFEEGKDTHIAPGHFMQLIEEYELLKLGDNNQVSYLGQLLFAQLQRKRQPSDELINEFMTVYSKSLSTGCGFDDASD